MSCSVYGGDPFSYDFRAALEQARDRQRQRHKRAEAEIGAAARVYWREWFPKAPTGDRLRMHAYRFGPEMVNDTAAAYGIDLRVKATLPKQKRHRRSTEALRATVLELHAGGLVDLAIADELNIADRRVREILNRAAAA